MVHAAGNQGTSTALVSAAYLLPKDAPLSVPVPGTDAPPIAGKPLVTSKFSLSGLTGDYDFTERVLDFAPGVWTPLHAHPGPVLLTVLEGEFTLREEGKESRYPAGTFWTETPGHVHMAGNMGTTNARVSAVYLVPKGAPLATIVQIPSGGLPLPNTGVAGAPVTFPETGYSLEGEFLAYWQAHGGLPVFGFPVDSARQVDGQVSQWLERARFELHPQNKPPYHVLLGRLGVESLERQGRPWQNLPQAVPTTPHYFRETGHAIAYGPFWSYWTSHGLEFDGRPGTSYAESLALFGAPISEAQMEVNSSGTRVLTQWFERARFEYHRNNPAAYRVSLGRLGAELQGQ
jgi:quercetin dioxygenase-like cupin family protein